MRSDTNWPIVHLNGNTAKSTTLLNASGGRSSHWITGYQLDGALADGDGFHLLRRACLYFDTNDTWTAADGGALLDIANEASNGHFAFEMWVYVPVATGAVASLLVRGNPATTGYKLEITSAGLVKFTIKDGTTACTITSTLTVLGGWHLITVVGQRNSTTGLNLYIDGVARATAVDTTAMNDAINPAGTLVVTGVSNKDMWIGPIGFYTGANAALSAATVLANYNEGIGRKYHGGETGLSVAWNNDEGTGTLCYDIKNQDGYKATVSGTAWSPSKQSGGTAAVNKCGPPFRSKWEDDAANPLPTVGLFGTGVLNTQGVMSPIVVTFPQAIEIGRNNPVRILETDGSFSLILHGFTGDA
jgi:hypothetical protein